MKDVVLLVLGLFLGAGGLTYVMRDVVRAGRARTMERKTMSVIVQAAALEATRRRHPFVTPQHVLWVLLEVPDVASTFEARAWPLKELRAALDAKLTGLLGDKTSKFQGPVSPDLTAKLRTAVLVTRQSRAQEARRAMLSALVRTMMERDPTVAELFEPRGGRALYGTFLLETRVPATVPDDLPEVPYRTARQAATADVVFLNDRRTTMAAVVEILTQVFELSDTRATYLMLTVHTEGRATVWSGARNQAEAMAARATTVARGKNMRLRIRVETAG